MRFLIRCRCFSFNLSSSISRTSAVELITRWFSGFARKWSFRWKQKGECHEYRRTCGRVGARVLRTCIGILRGEAELLRCRSGRRAQQTRGVVCSSSRIVRGHDRHPQRSAFAAGPPRYRVDSFSCRPFSCDLGMLPAHKNSEQHCGHHLCPDAVDVRHACFRSRCFAAAARTDQLWRRRLNRVGDQSHGTSSHNPLGNGRGLETKNRFELYKAKPHSDWTHCRLDLTTALGANPWYCHCSCRLSPANGCNEFLSIDRIDHFGCCRFCGWPRLGGSSHFSIPRSAPWHSGPYHRAIGSFICPSSPPERGQSVRARSFSVLQLPARYC